MLISSKIALFLSLSVAMNSFAKDKKKILLPDYVLRARTVMVVVNPGSEIPLADPGENRNAQDAVEQALLKWGRFKLALDSQTADLVISVRRGRAVSPTTSGGPSADRPVILQQPGDGQVRVGVEQGHPEVSEPSDNRSQNDGPRIGTEIGPMDDLMAVYRGATQYPLDNPAVWRYTAQNALQSPTVPAVGQFRKAIEQAEKQQKGKP
jgi:hypothetical protein